MLFVTMLAKIGMLLRIIFTRSKGTIGAVGGAGGGGGDVGDDVVALVVHKYTAESVRSDFSNCSGPVLGGSGVVISRVISRVTILITHIR